MFFVVDIPKVHGNSFLQIFLYDKTLL